MRSVYTIIVSCLVLMLVMASPVMAQPCPTAGSGSAGVAGFAQACTECPAVSVPATTCDGLFDITLTSVVRDQTLSLITFSYEVYAATGTGLNYWVLGLDLDKFQLKLAEGKTLSDLVVSCVVDSEAANVDCGLVLPDPTTQLNGLKFEAVIPSGQTQTFSITLDELALVPEVEIDEGCVVGATSADSQDIQRGANATPGYACITGPVVQQIVCPKTFGFWKTHPGQWPVSSLTLGSQTYSQSELLSLLKMPVRGDASVILARQLIAAKLNIANGSDPAPIASTIVTADSELSAFVGKLPYNVKTSTSTGHTMVGTAQILERYNGGGKTPHCEH